MNKYKIGDKVKIKSDLIEGKFYGKNDINLRMISYCNKKTTIKLIREDGQFKLKIDKGRFTWTKEMLEYIKKNPHGIAIEEVTVSDFFEGFSSINESYMDSVEISQPVILAEISPARYNLIDGNHRMEKARRMGLKSMLAYRLNVEQHMKFLTSKKAYVAYIEYWNSKLK